MSSGVGRENSVWRGVGVMGAGAGLGACGVGIAEMGERDATVVGCAADGGCAGAEEVPWRRMAWRSAGDVTCCCKGPVESAR